MATISVKDAAGSTVSGVELPNANGRAAASGSRPVALSNEDYAAIDGIEGSLSTIAGAIRAEDAASADGHTGMVLLAVRQASPANSSGTDGDYETVRIDGGNLWVKLGAALPAGANAIGKLAANSGVDIGDTDVTSVIPGTGATNLGKAEDAAHASGDVGVMALGVQKAAPADLGADGDYGPPQFSQGGMWVRPLPPIASTLTPTLDTSAYTSGDVLFATTVASGFFRNSDGAGSLISLRVNDKDDNGQAFTLYFLNANNSLGTINTAPSISDANADAIIGSVRVTTSDYDDLGGCKVANINGINIPLSAASGTSSIYVAAVLNSGSPTYTASGITLRFVVAE